MIFSQGHLESFRKLSGDENPLHLSAESARRSQFGRVVVYGVAAVLAALDEWAKGRSYRLLSIKAKFEKSLFLGEDYPLSIEEKGQTVTIRILKEKTTQTKITLTWEEAPVLSAGKLPRDQLQALAWSSYYVGMKNPGTQALFAELKFTFSRESVLAFEPGEIHITHDERFKLVTITGQGDGVESFELTAFERPQPIDYPLRDILSSWKPQRSLDSKTVFISGASRGFGAVLAKVCALEGADLALTYRGNSPEIHDIAKEMKPHAHRMALLKGDLSLEKDCLRIADELRGQLLNLVILNAFPHIPTAKFLEQSTDEFMAFQTSAVRMQANLCKALLPHMAPGGQILHISSVFSSHPEPGFSHYIAAKSAVEGLMRALSVEHPQLGFVSARLPRMLTDQTNTVSRTQEPESAITVATRLFEKMAFCREKVGFHEFEV